MMRLVVLDNEAVRALQDPAHPKHRHVVSHAHVAAHPSSPTVFTPPRAGTSRKRRAAAIQVVVPTAVRVEAGWDRTSPAWVFPNRLRIADSPLDTVSASMAAGI